MCDEQKEPQMCLRCENPMGLCECILPALDKDDYIVELREELSDKDRKIAQLEEVITRKKDTARKREEFGM